LYSFIWGDFCDWFLEVSKPQLREGDAKHAAFMAYILETSMRLLQPFMPFISEEIWSKLPHQGDTLSLADWPVAGPTDLAVEAEFALLQDAIRASRNLRSESNIPPGKKLNISFVALTERAQTVLNAGNGYLTQLSNLETASIVTPDSPRPENATSSQLAEFEVWLPLEGLIDVEKERAKLEKQLETAQKEHAKVSNKLGNAAFVDKAPREVVEKEEAKRAEFASQIEKLSQRLAAL
ncbi:valine--tRNA ligase, partial [bacterium]